MAPPPTEVFSAFAFVGFVFCVIPLPWHLEAWNTGTCMFMFWTGIGCLNLFINSIVWNGNAINWAPVWCDISAKLIVGGAVGIPAASLCINRRLFYISRANAVTSTKAERRRAVLIDLAIGMGIPVLEMVLQYVVQGHRFDIYEDVGCYPFTYRTPVSIALVDIWPIAIGLVSGVYCVLSIIEFNKRRAQFKELLSANKSLTINRYFRLMALAGTDALLTVPLSVFVLSLNLKHGTLSPWISWEDTHYGFSRVDQIPAILWRSNSLSEGSLEFSRWLMPFCAFVFFAFFGFADEAIKHYRIAADSMAKKMGYSTITSWFAGSSNVTRSGTGMMSSTGRGATLPVFVSKEIHRKRDSMESFTNMTASFSGDDSEYKSEKSFMGPDLSYDGLELNDAGGALADVQKPTDVEKVLPATPRATLLSPASNDTLVASTRSHRDSEYLIEVSSVRMSSASIQPPAPVFRPSDAGRYSPSASNNV